MITAVYKAKRGSEDVVTYVRLTDAQTGTERLVEPYELPDPEGLDVGTEPAYQVSLLKDEAFQYKNTY